MNPPPRRPLDDPRTAAVLRAGLALQRKSWEQGMLAQAAWELGETELLVALARAMLVYRTDDGLVAHLAGSPLDAAMCGEPLWRAALATGDPELGDAADALLGWIRTGAPRASDGTLLHYDDRMLSDSCHTAAPYLAVRGDAPGALAQLEGYRRRLLDPERGLFRAVWDETAGRVAATDFWGRMPGDAYWGVGNGWVAVALTRVIRALPADGAEREGLVALLGRLVAACLDLERPDGRFHNVLDRPETFVETNTGQMLAYAILEGVRGGWLAADLLPAADRLRAAAHGAVDGDGFVRGVAGAPRFSDPGIAPEGQAFFLLMEAAAARLGR